MDNVDIVFFYGHVLKNLDGSFINIRQSHLFDFFRQVSDFIRQITQQAKCATSG